jgi:hypothetical protein
MSWESERAAYEQDSLEVMIKMRGKINIAEDIPPLYVKVDGVYWQRMEHKNQWMTGDVYPIIISNYRRSLTPTFGRL